MPKKIVVLTAETANNFEILEPLFRRAPADICAVFVDGVPAERFGKNLKRVLKFGLLRLPKALLARLAGMLSGRQKSITRLCAQNKIEVHKIRDMNSAKTIALLNRLAPDLVVCAGFNQILKKDALGVCPAINLHRSLLPKFGNSFPIHRALAAKETETGVTIHFMSEKVDSGKILAQAKVRIEKNDSVESLYQKTSAVGGKLLADTVETMLAGKKR
ncbi:MAG: hypothetical protein HY394_01820 [Candidatus Diapherotrites archaeon]|nr:hypothetical protein [Candidatus Diapherotrites archaeon]